MSSGKYIDTLLDKYAIEGTFDKVAETLAAQAPSRNLLEKAQWLVRDSDVPTETEIHRNLRQRYPATGHHGLPRDVRAPQTGNFGASADYPESRDSG